AFLLDANLPVVVDDYLTLTTCQEGFAILNKSDMKSGKKMSSDPLYNMAAQYVAAALNYHAGAFRCPVSDDAVNQAFALMNKYKFTGTGAYLKLMSAADQALANTIAAQLDAYNNNNFAICPP